MLAENWLSIAKNGYPEEGFRVLTYSECYRGKPEMEYRIMDSQFVPISKEVSHYSYLRNPYELS